MWILIMTLVTANGGVGMASSEFNSQKACNDAGFAWKGTVDSFGRNADFICVQKGDKQ